MHDFKIVFTLFVLAFVSFKGLAEGKHLMGVNNSFKGSTFDRQRKGLNDFSFFIFMCAMLFINMQAIGNEMSIVYFLSAIFWGGAIRYFFRDGMQNKVTGKPWIYTGSVSTVEKYLGSKKLWLNWLIKLVLIISFGLIFYLVK